MFWGGDDIPPQAYHEKTNLLTGCFTQDRLYEVSLMFHLIGGNRNTSVKAFLEERPDYAILGICLGMQMMNVASGGTLYQDIPTEIYMLKNFEEVITLGENNIHRNYWKGFIYDDSISNYCFHKFKIRDKSILKEIAKGDLQPTVLSYHHQCINKKGANIKITATSLDGKVIEGIEHVKYKNVYGVQFHPEYLVLYDHNDKIRMKPGDELSSSDKLLDDESRLFYKDFWKYFSDVITTN
jgi:putative glutamine amidotransferase